MVDHSAIIARWDRSPYISRICILPYYTNYQITKKKKVLVVQSY